MKYELKSKIKVKPAIYSIEKSKSSSGIQLFSLYTPTILSGGQLFPNSWPVNFKNSC